jgi:hypothetical protein
METVELTFWIEKLIGAIPVLLQVFAHSFELATRRSNGTTHADPWERGLCPLKKFPTSLLRSTLTPLGVHKKKTTRNETKQSAQAEA